MAHKCYISFKTEDFRYKLYIQTNLGVDMIDRSLDRPIDSQNEDYILQRIRDDYLADSTVTIHLIGPKSAENLGWSEQRFIKRELQGSLSNTSSSTRNGILGVVLPEMMNSVYGGSFSCMRCGGSHNLVQINDTTVVKEFSYNYYLPNNKCAHDEDDRYCVLVPWNDFVRFPEDFIEQAFQKRTHPISSKVRVYGGER